MLRRPMLLVVVALLAAAVPSAALAARVHVRVEGKTQTIFGAVEPVVEAADALQALDSASFVGEFYYHVASTSFGPYVDQVGRYPAAGTAGWVFKVNGASPPVAADQVKLGDGDRVLWYWADFGSGSGPSTLNLVRGRDKCYRVFMAGDNGVSVAAVGAVLHVGSKRTVRTRGGVACVARHRGLLVRATLPGAVRSNALP